MTRGSAVEGTAAEGTEEAWLGEGPAGWQGARRNAATSSRPMQRVVIDAPRAGSRISHWTASLDIVLPPFVHHTRRTQTILTNRATPGRAGSTGAEWRLDLKAAVRRVANRLVDTQGTIRVYLTIRRGK